MDKLCDWCEENEGSDEEPCWECKREMICRNCNGAGDYAEMRDSTGRLDYLHGNPTGRRLTCNRCQGKGWTE